MEQEFWKQVPGYSGLYEVSSFGKVRRYFPPSKYSPAGTIHYLKPITRRKKGNYEQLVVTLSAKKLLGPGTKAHCFPLARLVALTFLGPPPSTAHQAAHNDGDPLNNRVDNIRWATQDENEADKFLHGTRPAKWETHCPQGHLKEGVAKNGRRFCTICKDEFKSRLSDLERRVAELEQQIHELLDVKRERVG